MDDAPEPAIADRLLPLPELAEIAAIDRKTLEELTLWLLGIEEIRPLIATWYVRRHDTPPGPLTVVPPPADWPLEPLADFVHVFAKGAVVRELKAVLAERERTQERLKAAVVWLERTSAPELRVLADLLRRPG